MILFPKLIGNEKIKETAASDIYRGFPSHAYIIEGPAGSGRHTAALQIASSLMCERKSKDRFPCGECLPCRKVSEGICTDVIFVNHGTKASIGIDAVREIKSSLNYAPVEMEYKVYIIEEADKMTVQAQNSLLLSLEEPPSFVVFILLCTDSTLLLETVRSRAPIFKTELFPTDKVFDYLSKNAKDSGDKDRMIAAAASGGSLGKALSLLGDKNSEEAKEAELCRKILPTLLSGSLSERYGLLKSFPTKREEAVSFLKALEAALRDLVCVKKAHGAELLFFFDKDEASELSSKTSAKRLVVLQTKINDAIFKISSNVSVQPVLALLLTEN